MALLAQPGDRAVDAIFKLLSNPRVWLPILGAVVGLVTRWWRKFSRHMKSLRANRAWPAVSAIIEICTVAERVDADKKQYAVAVLTYFYRHPELETGDFEREFPGKSEARRWADQFKGRQVIVRINPADPSESFLQSSDLEGSDAPAPPGNVMPSESQAAPAIRTGYLFVSSIAELLSIGGMGLSAVLLWLSIASGGKFWNRVAVWSGAVLLAVSLVSGAIVSFRLHREENAQSIFHSYNRWCPSWLRWTSKSVGVVFGFFVLLNHLYSALPGELQSWLKTLSPHILYAMGFWAFLSCASFHAAIRRSQEESRIAVPASAGQLQ